MDIRVNCQIMNQTVKSDCTYLSDSSTKLTSDQLISGVSPDSRNKVVKNGFFWKLSQISFEANMKVLGELSE